MDQSKHILVVDDNDDVRDVIVNMLQAHSYRVNAASGGAAMRDFLETGDRVDCVILDAVMPGEATASLLIYLKERGLPVIIISGNPAAMKYAEDNNLQLLDKPFRADELYSAITSALVGGDANQRNV